MAQEAKPGEFTLVYNLAETGHPVGLTPDQHRALQVFVAALSKAEPVSIVQSVRIIHETNIK